MAAAASTTTSPTEGNIYYFPDLSAPPKLVDVTTVFPAGFRVHNEPFATLTPEKDSRVPGAIEITPSQIVPNDAFAICDVTEKASTARNLALVLIRKIKKGDTILYPGKIITSTGFHPYAFGVELSGSFTVTVDALAEGNLSRFIAHLPGKETEVLSTTGQEYALSNLDVQRVKIKGEGGSWKHYIALRASRDIEASLTSPRLLGYNYGLTYWQGRTFLLRLFDQHGKVIDPKFYIFNDSSFILEGSRILYSTNPFERIRRDLIALGTRDHPEIISVKAICGGIYPSSAYAISFLRWGIECCITFDAETRKAVSEDNILVTTEAESLPHYFALDDKCYVRAGDLKTRYSICEENLPQVKKFVENFLTTTLIDIVFKLFAVLEKRKGKTRAIEEYTQLYACWIELILKDLALQLWQCGFPKLAQTYLDRITPTQTKGISLILERDHLEQTTLELLKADSGLKHTDALVAALRACTTNPAETAKAQAAATAALRELQPKLVFASLDAEDTGPPGVLAAAAECPPMRG